MRAEEHSSNPARAAIFVAIGVVLIGLVAGYYVFQAQPAGKQLIGDSALAQPSEESAIRAVLETQRIAWNIGNLEAFMVGYWPSDSLVFIGSSGTTYGWQPTLDNYRKNYPNPAAMGQLAFTILKVDVLAPDAAFVIGKWALDRNAPQEDVSGHFTLLFKKKDGGWQIVADHSS